LGDAVDRSLTVITPPHSKGRSPSAENGEGKKKKKTEGNEGAEPSRIEFSKASLKTGSAGGKTKVKHRENQRQVVIKTRPKTPVEKG